MHRASVLLLPIFAVIAAIVLGLLQPGAAQPLRPALAPAGECPPVQITPTFTYAYGTVQLDGAPAPAGTVVEAVSPRGDVVGCFVVGESTPGNYGAMPIYGEDTSVNPPIPGMRTGETVTFRVNGAVATAVPLLVWQNDKDLHEVALTAWSPTPTPTNTPTPTSTPTPTNTPTPTHTPTVPNLPDLIVKNIQVAPASPIIGQALAVTVTLKNQGTAAATGRFYTDVYADHVPAGCNDLGWTYGETNELAPGDVAILTFTYGDGFSTTGTHFIRAFVDSSCQITEADETNNVNLLRVTVVSAATPTPTPTPTATPLPPVAPVVTIARDGNNVVLTWAHAAQNATYQVWRGADPYFAPGAGATLIGDGATGNCSNAGGTITCTDSASLGDPAANVFYLVRAFNAAGASADSNRAGEFDFALQPGSP